MQHISPMLFHMTVFKPYKCCQTQNFREYENCLASDFLRHSILDVRILGLNVYHLLKRPVLLDVMKCLTEC
jgi:hypothetical protein